MAHLRGGRTIRCLEVGEDGDQWLLVKRAGTIMVAKAEVERIERLSTSSTQPATQPSTQPTTAPASETEVP